MGINPQTGLGIPHSGGWRHPRSWKTGWIRPQATLREGGALPAALPSPLPGRESALSAPESRRLPGTGSRQMGLRIYGVLDASSQAGAASSSTPKRLCPKTPPFPLNFSSYLPLPVSFPTETTAKQQVLLCSVSNPIPSAPAKNGNHKSSSRPLRARPGEEQNSNPASKPFYCSLGSVTFSPGFAARPREKL